MYSPALTFALAVAAGMLAQVLAGHLRIPGIVLLLAVGVLLGPDGAGLIRPEDLGEGLPILVGFAVAVILFEGAMNLNLRRLRREAVTIRRLVIFGAAITFLGGGLAARCFLGWEWRLSLLFGTLVVVTGPTVINPLMRRIRVKSHLATILEAEGVLVDAVGAVIAVLALEIVLSPPADSFTAGFWHLFSRLGFGVFAGLLAAGVLVLILRIDYLTPEGLENIFVLSLVLAVFQISNALFSESGLVAVTTAGLVVGNVRSQSLNDLKDFKEQLTVLLIGVLFVLLAADVRISDVGALGSGGIFTVLALMLLVRPLCVSLSTWGSGLSISEKTFLAWIAPRGIVAAAVSSLFAQEMGRSGLPGGAELQALVFLVIAVTVLVQGLTGGIAATLLGVRRARARGYVVMGANALGLTIGRLFREEGEEIIFIDSNPERCAEAEKKGFRIFYGNALQESMMLRAELDTRMGCLALTANDNANLMFAQRARQVYKTPRAWVALSKGQQTVTESMVRQIGADVLFCEPRRTDLWSLRLERRIAAVEVWEKKGAGEEGANEECWRDEDSFLPLLYRRGKTFLPVDGRTSFAEGDTVWLALFEERREHGEEWLRRRGWVPVRRDARTGSPSTGAAPPADAR